MDYSKNIDITIHERDILKRVNDSEHADLVKKYPRVSFTDTGALIDELAYSADQWTSNELDENNIDAGSESIKYVCEHFGFEDALLAATKTKKKLTALLEALEDTEFLARTTGGKNPRTNLQAGAYYALHYPEAWADLLKQYEEKCDDEKYSHYDSAFLSAHAPTLAKELQEAEDSARTDLYREWLNGDYRNYSGVLVEIAKYYGASEALEYSDKTPDRAVFTFEAEELHEKYCGCYSDNGKCTERMTAKKYKSALLDDIYSSSNARREKEKAERARRKEERERVTAYKAQRAAEEEAARIKKLKSLKK